MFGLFAVFILGCGMTHLVGLVTLWQPVYGLQGLTKVATALVSAFTAVAVWPVIPQALALPSPTALRSANRRLEEEILRREAARRELQAVRDDLERRVRERTRELEDAMDRRSRQRDHYEALYRRTPVMMHSTDESGRLIDVNDVWLESTGYRREEVVGHPISTFTVGEIAPPVATDPSTAAVPCVFRRKDGSRFDGEMSTIVHPLDETGRLAAFAVVVDVTERNASRLALEQRAAELVAANESLRQFAYVASHDLQEPLRKIATYADVLKEGLDRADEEEVRYSAAVMRASASRARTLVADLLAYARTQNRTLEPALLDPAVVVGEALQVHSTAIAETAAEVAVAVEPVRLAADATLFARVMENLVGNALKFHRADAAPVVRIVGRRTGAGGYELSVADEGIGFEPAYAAEIFEPFRRMHGRRDIEGSGIGLAIVKAAAFRLGWSIAAEGRPGKGATLTISVPPASTHPAGEAAARGSAGGIGSLGQGRA